MSMKKEWGRSWHLRQGVLNGIDTALWDPVTDPFLPAPYSAADTSGKALCKRCAEWAGCWALCDRTDTTCVPDLVSAIAQTPLACQISS